MPEYVVRFWELNFKLNISATYFLNKNFSRNLKSLKQPIINAGKIKNKFWKNGFLKMFAKIYDLKKRSKIWEQFFNDNLYLHFRWLNEIFAKEIERKFWNPFWWHWFLNIFKFPQAIYTNKEKNCASFCICKLLKSASLVITSIENQNKNDWFLDLTFQNWAVLNKHISQFLQSWVFANISCFLALYLYNVV